MVEDRIVLLAHEETIRLAEGKLSSIVYDFFNFSFLLVSVVLELAHLHFFGKEDVRDILKPFLFELFLNGSQDTGWYSGISDQFLDTMLLMGEVCDGDDGVLALRFL